MSDSRSSSGRHARHRHHDQQQQQQQQPPATHQQVYDDRGVEVTPRLNRVSSGKSSHFSGSHSEQDGGKSYRAEGDKSYSSRHHGDNRSAANYPNVPPAIMAPTTGQFRSGHIEVDSLYGQGSSGMVVNAMNAPNNSTMQCGCENIDCPFCNLMTSVQMKDSQY